MWSLLVWAAMSVGCGWGYAQRAIGERPPTEKRVVVVEPELPPPPVVKKDPCAVSVLTLYKLQARQRLIRELECKTGRVIKETEQPLNEEMKRRYMAMNMPSDVWFLMVDPRGQEPGTITNDQLLGLDKRYSLRYHQQVPGSGLIIYRFEELTATP